MGRVPYWNVSLGIIIDLLAVPVAAVFIYGLYLHWKRIRQGQVRLKLNLPSVSGKIGPVYVGALLFKGILGSKIYKKIF